MSFLIRLVGLFDSLPSLSRPVSKELICKSDCSIILSEHAPQQPFTPVSLSAGSSIHENIQGLVGCFEHNVSLGDPCFDKSYSHFSQHLGHIDTLQILFEELNKELGTCDPWSHIGC